jgi:DNA polymerase
VGRAGKLLDKIIIAMGFERKDIYIANIVKCHPMINPENPEMRGNDRPPTKEESLACLPHLEKQIALIKPDYIVALGSVSAKILLDRNTSLGSMRGVFHDYPKDILDLGNLPKIVVTYHPAALLRNPNWKKPCWEDIKMLLTEMGLPVANKK